MHTVALHAHSTPSIKEYGAAPVCISRLCKKKKKSDGWIRETENDLVVLINQRNKLHEDVNAFLEEKINDSARGKYRMDATLSSTAKSSKQPDVNE